MPILKSKKTTTAADTQEFLEIDEIKDDIVVLKDGSLRGVLMASSLNFELKSTEEQEALIYRYQSFLNSIDFPLQIVINSRKLTIDDYVKMLKEKEREQDNELLRTQTLEYIDFIQDFVKFANIMNKYFYLIVPFAPIEAKEEGPLAKLKGIMKPKEVVKLEPEKFKQYKDQLSQRINHISIGLAGLEIRTIPLNTKQLIEFFYNLYNPGIEKKLIEKIAAVKQ